MAPNALLMIVIVMMVAVLATPSCATEYVVGDYSGWTLGVDYASWANGKQFYVGDKLIFKYVEGKHNVYKVNGTTAFQQCSVPSESGGLTSGNDVITLATPGSKWYICGVGEHCNYGMKLVIDVSCAVAPASAPAPMVVVQDKKKSMGFWRFWNLY